MTNPIPWQRLMELAERATPGPWSTGPAHVIRRRWIGDRGCRSTQYIGEIYEQAADAGIHKHNAAFIAALDPATVLQMVAEHAAVREALAELVACDDIMERLATPHIPEDERARLTADYAHRDLAAWDAARAALTGGEP